MRSDKGVEKMCLPLFCPPSWRDVRPVTKIVSCSNVIRFVQDDVGRTSTREFAHRSSSRIGSDGGTRVFLLPLLGRAAIFCVAGDVILHGQVEVRRPADGKRDSRDPAGFVRGEKRDCGGDVVGSA